MGSVQFSRSVVSDSLQPHRLQHARPPCPSPTPVAYSNSYNPLNAVAHPSWNVSKSQPEREEDMLAVGHMSPVEVKATPDGGGGTEVGGWHVGWVWPSGLKMPTCLQLQQITQPKLPFTILSRPLSSRHFLKILTENIIYAHWFF